MRLSNLELSGVLLFVSLLLALQGRFTVFGIVSGVTNDESICIRDHSRTVWRVVTFRETYKRKWVFFKKVATRINSRLQGFVEWYPVKECCPGYLPDRGWPLTCYPHCLSGCPHGICQRPNVCICDSGYRTSLNHTLGGTCVPDCGGDGVNDDGCGDNARCAGPAKCECHIGYTFTVKKLHPTDNPEYVLPCIPKCDPECAINAYCQGPNKCQCNAGYRSAAPNSEKHALQCVPVCEENCINGICSAPNKCSCLSGYIPHPTNEFMCEPFCENDCFNAKCVEPNHCACHEGYQKNSTDPPNVCSPVCDPLCINAECNQPDQCECHQGYEKNPTGLSHVCLPICDPSCINGNCTSPNYCECHEGYGKNSEDSSEICSPICNSPCINANCSQPNHCDCHEGYGKNLKDPSEVCSPVCDPACINAECTQPNHCECHHGYEKNSKGLPHICVPICNPPCINATCSQPNQCECHDGYGKNPTGPSQFCSPICDPPCDSHASCESPNECICTDGYVVASVGNSSSDNNRSISTVNTTIKPRHTYNTKKFENAVTCQPLCQPECTQNANCVAPNVCQCDVGYRSTSSSNQTRSETQCLPVCEKDCVNAYCAHPNECICHLGYKPSSVDNSVCEPSCEHDCINGNCTQPNYCECYDGYKKAEIMLAESHGSVIMSENLCIPNCHEKCLSANCIAPNKCICNPGYGYAETSTDTSELFCQPLCEPTCPIGLECVAPDHCEPQFGQDQDNNELSTNFSDIVNTTEIYSREDGIFNENNTRVCNYGWTGSSCDEPSFCVIIFTADNGTDEQFSIVQSLAIAKNWTDYDESNDENAEMLDWNGPRCRAKCRISILPSKTSGNIREEIIYCRKLDVFNATNDSISIETESLISEVENEIIVCFVKAGSKCNTLESQMFGDRGTFYGVVGVALLLVVVTSLASAIYLVCRKRRITDGISGVSMNDSIITKWPDSTSDSFIESSSI